MCTVQYAHGDEFICFVAYEYTLLHKSVVTKYKILNKIQKKIKIKNVSIVYQITE